MPPRERGLLPGADSAGVDGRMGPGPVALLAASVVALKGWT